MDQGISFEARPRPQRPKFSFSRTDWQAFFAVLACAAVFAFMHPGLFAGGEAIHLPGIGLTLSCWILLAICMNSIGWKSIQHSKASFFLFISTLLLSSTYGIFENNTLRLMNFPVLGALFVLTVYSMKHGAGTLEPDLLFSSVRQAAHSIAHYIPAPVCTLLDMRKSGSKRYLKELLLGLGVCIPVIGFLLVLLCDADSMFGSMIGNVFQKAQSPDIALVAWNIVRMVVITLLAFAFIYGINRVLPLKKETASVRRLPEITMITLLTAMSMVYAAFVYIQCRYLFSGSSASLMAEDYAVYARSGFFQLVIVAIITMLIVMPSLCKLPESRCVRMLCALVTLLTMVIVVSAFWRMRLYIMKFGFTFLRAVTLWGILAITAAMIAALIKAALPDVRIFRPLFIFAVCSWILFNYTNIYARIADYNLSAYQRGALEAVDIAYMERLGPEALDVLDVLREDSSISSKERGDVIKVRSNICKSRPVAYDWSFSWLKLDK